MVTSRYVIYQNGPVPPKPILLEHCCLMVKGNTWVTSVECWPHSNQSKKKKKWQNIQEVYPDAKVETKHNDIRLTLPVLRESLEVAAFGTPGKDDQKWMQMAIFGKEPTKACEWRIRVYLIDDSVQGNTFTPDLYSTNFFSIGIKVKSKEKKKKN